MANNEIIEVRQIYERADFSIVVQKEAVGESSRRLRGAFERGCGKGVSDIQA